MGRVEGEGGKVGLERRNSDVVQCPPGGLSIRSPPFLPSCRHRLGSSDMSKYMQGDAEHGEGRTKEQP